MRILRYTSFALLVALVLSLDVSAAIPGQDDETFSAAERQNNLGTQHAARGDYRQAAGAFRKAVDLDPSMTIAHYNLGLSLSRVDNHADAAYAFRSAIRLSPSYFDAWFQLGLSLLKTEKHDKASDAFEECLELKRRDPGSRFRLGQAYWKVGDWKAVIAQWDSLLIESPGHPSNQIVIREIPRAYYNVGLHYQATGDFSAAREAYEDALRLDARYVPALNNLGILHQAVDETDEAIELFERVLEIDADHFGSRLGLAGAFKAAGRIPEAIEQYGRLRESAPHEARVYRGLALAYAATGDREQAKEWLSEAVARMEPYAGLLLNAFVLEHGTSGERYGVGYQEEAALAVYDEIISAYPEQPQAHYNLGVIHARGSRWTDAVAAFDRALAIDSTYAAAQAALDEVERITKAQNQQILRIKRP